MARKFVAALFALLALAAGSAGAFLALNNTEAATVLLEAPEAAREQALSLMEALCAGEFAEAEAMLYGQPLLGLDTPPEDPVATLFFDAYQQSLTYQLKRDCYATDRGIALDVEVTALDVAAMLSQLRSRSQAMLEQRIAEAEDVTEVYDENGEYLESVVMDALYAAARKILEEEAVTQTVTLSLDCVHDGDRWWVIPGDLLMEIMGCGTGW